MSRIEEALRRVTERVSRAPGEELLRGEGVALERYPAERARVSADPGPDASTGVRHARERTGLVVARRAVRRPFRSLSPELDGKLLLSENMPPIAVEQYRRLAMTLHQAQDERPLKTVLISSAAPFEGKTLTSINLALTLSESYGRRVLLVDADLRRPAIHQVLHLPNLSGLGDTLRGSPGPLPFVELSDTLTVLTAGKADPDPMEGLCSPAMKRFLADAAARFDWVIIDSPPAAVCTDAPLLAPLTDGVLLVIRAGVTSSALVQRAVSGFSPGDILGVILNGADSATLPTNDYYEAYSGSASAGESL
jgi:capsular exopolysaccharide synthesis family protein